MQDEIVPGRSGVSGHNAQRLVEELGVETAKAVSCPEVKDAGGHDPKAEEELDDEERAIRKESTEDEWKDFALWSSPRSGSRRSMRMR